MEKGLVDFFELFGLKLSMVVAALIGAVASLAFAKSLSTAQALTIVFCGLGFGTFGSGALVGYLQWHPTVAGGIAFVLSVLAMPILGLAFGFVSRLRDRSAHLADRAADKALGPEAEKKEEPKP
jgi:hypothetical protein